MAKPRKIRIDFRKNRSVRRRGGDLTRSLSDDPDGLADMATSERLSGKGDLTRKRTIIEPGADIAVDSWRGQVLHVHGLESFVRRDDGHVVRCTTRRVLRTMTIDQRHPVVAGDWVTVRQATVPDLSAHALPTTGPDGIRQDATIQSVDPRRNELARNSRGRRHVIVANIDQVVIVGSAAQPHLKPGLIDRMLVAAECAGIRPLICLNKADLVPVASLVPLAGVYARMGYRVILCSAVTGMGIARLRAELRGAVSAVVGQSGVGKSSLLNHLQPDLALPVSEVSRDNDKGRHTTTTARLIPHRLGGAFVDTPGVRQFQLWDIVPAEVPAAFRDLRPLANLCRFPDCTHSHEADCAVKDGVADGLLDTRRWESCCHLATNLGEDPEDDE